MGDKIISNDIDALTRISQTDVGLNIFYFEKFLCTTYIVIISIHYDTNGSKMLI